MYRELIASSGIASSVLLAILVSPARGVGESPAVVGRPLGDGQVQVATESQFSESDEGSVANGCVVFRLTPVNPPPGQPPYPPGTIVDTENSTITLRAGGQTVWFDVLLSDWACVGDIRGWQAGIGHKGVLPPGVSGVHFPCVSASDCEDAGFGPPESPALGESGARCDPSGECRTVWEDSARPDWLVMDIAACNSAVRSCGGTNLDANNSIADDGTERYGMTVALEIDASFVGTVQIPFADPDVKLNFVIPEGGFEGAFPGKTIPATVIVDPSIPTVSEWGLVIMTLGLLAVAKTQFSRRGRWERV